LATSMPVATAGTAAGPATGGRCDRGRLIPGRYGGFAHALICQRVALPSFSVLAKGRAWEERTMKELVLPVPETVSAT
jgi:hypothetical protein